MDGLGILWGDVRRVTAEVWLLRGHPCSSRHLPELGRVTLKHTAGHRCGLKHHMHGVHTVQTRLDGRCRVGCDLPLEVESGFLFSLDKPHIQRLQMRRVSEYPVLVATSWTNGTFL